MTTLKVIDTGSRRGNCYVLNHDGELLLLDFGCKWEKILEGIGFKPSKISGALLTHQHMDHAKCYKELMSVGIPIYTNDETAEHFDVVAGERMMGIPEGQWLSIGNFKVIPLYVPLDGVPNYMYLIKIPDGQLMMYATDFMYLPKTFKGMHISTFLIECNHLDADPEKDAVNYKHSIKGHSSLDVVKNVIRANRTELMKNVILCHISEAWGDPELMRNEIKESTGDTVTVDVAEPGLERDISLFPF